MKHCCSALVVLCKKLSWISQIWNLIAILDRSEFDTMWIELPNISKQNASWFWIQMTLFVCSISYKVRNKQLCNKLQVSRLYFTCIKDDNTDSTINIISIFIIVICIVIVNCLVLFLPPVLYRHNHHRGWSFPIKFSKGIVIIIIGDDNFQSKFYRDRLFGVVFATRHWQPAIERVIRASLSLQYQLDKIKIQKYQKLKYKIQTLPEAQRTQGIESFNLSYLSS